MDQRHINYSQVWEDPDILHEALSISASDRVLSVTSGGDNTLALLCAGPQHIVSIDLNPTQNYVLEFKKAAAKHLSYEEYLELLGTKQSMRRLALFEKIRYAFSEEAQVWWAHHPILINRGVVHTGRFEKFTAFFARYILPLIHSKKTIAKLLACRSLDEQRAFYKNIWDSSRWQFFFSLASNRLMLKRFARQKGMFTYAEGKTVSDVYRERLARHLTSVPIQGNYFLQYSLLGRYVDALPPYLSYEGYKKLREVPESTLSVVTSNLLDFLKSAPDNSISKFNLSDIGEALSPHDNDTLWDEIVRTATQGAIVAYWNNLVRRSYPPRLSSHIHTNEEQLEKLRAKDKVFFYDRFYAHTILK